MLLRRVIEHVREQEWTAIFIDFVIVVVGVFVGIQVANWNEQRHEDEQSRVFTERLKADMREEDWRYQFLIQYHREVLANANRAAAALEGTAPLSDEALLVSAYRATQYKQGLRRRSTYDELIATGTIGLIRDQGLRDTAMRLYSIPTIDNLVREGMTSGYRAQFRMTVPNEVQRALGHQCGDRVLLPGDYAHIRGNIDFPCASGLPPAAIADAAARLRASPELLPLLRLRIADIETRLVDMTGNNRTLMESLRTFAEQGR